MPEYLLLISFEGTLRILWGEDGLFIYFRTVYWNALLDLNVIWESLLAYSTSSPEDIKWSPSQLLPTEVVTHMWGNNLINY